MKDINTAVFLQRIEAMSSRLEQLYHQAHESPARLQELLPLTWRELGVATEELQVANEELQQQNEEMSFLVQEASAHRYYYQDLLNSLPQAHLVTTMEGKILEANTMAARLLRVDSSLLLGKLLISFVLDEQRQTFRSELIGLARSQNQPPRRWLMWFRPRGMAPAQLMVTAAMAPHVEGSGKILHWLLWDVTEPPLLPSPARTLALAPTESPADSAVQYPVLTYSKGETVPLSPQTLYQVQQGVVKLHTLTDDGEEVLLGWLNSKMVFGLGMPFMQVYQATAVTEVQVAPFSLTDLQASAPLAQQLLLNLYQRVQYTEALLAVAGQRRIRQRLAWLLRLLRQELGEPVPQGIRLRLRLTHEEIANACCTSRVTITRLLGELQRQQKITLDSKCHIILSEQF